MFDFVDLFAGIGGFHGALAGLGGRGVQAAEIDRRAAAVYSLNWGLQPDVDVRELAMDPARLVKDHAVLAGGFPCQPFSKSGFQRGMSEQRGTLFHDIVKILKIKRPPVVILENVRNIAGPRQRETWKAVVHGLRDAGYKVSGTPCVFSPHLLPPQTGGAAQIRERVYILGTYVGRTRAMAEIDEVPVLERRPQLGWDPARWSIKTHVIDTADRTTRPEVYRLTAEEHLWINTWNELLARLGPDARIPGHPLWSDVWRPGYKIPCTDPPWKQTFQRQNLAFYRQNRREVDAWRKANKHLAEFPASRRKLEWQAQDAPRDLWQLLLHFRPSGIRAKRPTYAPALVAMGQTSVYGPERRRLTPEETAVLQGLPSGFKFGPQVDSLSYRQLGNAVNLGTASYVFTKYVETHATEIAAAKRAGALVDGVAVVESVLCAAARTVAEVAADVG